MKKKLVCLFLVLCTVMALLPVLAAPVAAAEEPVDYEDLYVKKDLVIWLDGFDGTDSKIDLVGGKWTSKIGDGSIYATIKGGAYDAESNKTGWEVGENGRGVKWTQRSNVSTTAKNNGLYFDNELIPDGSWTMEAVMTSDGITEEDNTRTVLVSENGFTYGQGLGENIAIGTFKNYAYVAMCSKGGSTNHSDNLGYRWYYTGLVYTDHYTNYAGKSIYKISEEKTLQKFAVGEAYGFSMKLEYLAADKVETTVTYNGTVGATGQATPSAMGTPPPGGVLPANNAGYGPTNEDKPGNVKFQLFVGMAGTVYEVRIYNRALTADEQAQNLFVDIARFTGADLSAYLKMESDTLKKIAWSSVGKLGFTASKEDVEAAIAGAQAEYDAEQERIRKAAEERQKLLDEVKDRAKDKYDKYYVTDGLFVWLDAMVSLPEWNTDIDLEAGTWKSKVGDVVATIGGAKYFTAGADGRGIGYRFTKEQYKASLSGSICPAGIFLDPELLPTKLTMDSVAILAGLTNPDGTRYEDPETSADVWGVYTSNFSTFSFGALKTMTFICTSHAAHGTPFGHRWCFTAMEWNEHNGGAGYKDDTSLNNTPLNFPVAYTIVKNQPNIAVTNAEEFIAMKSAFSAGYTTIGDDDPEFEMFHGLPSTIYAIRLYNRVLFDWERSQNHMADLLSYYNLDTAFLDLVLGSIDDPKTLYVQFDDLGFDMTKEEANDAFRNALSGAWIQSLGVQAKLSGHLGVRAVFEIDEEGIAKLEAAGYKVEIGALLNIGGAYPTLDTAQYKVTFRKADGSTNDAFYITKNNGGKSDVAFGVTYNRATPMLRVTDLKFASYFIMTAADGTVTNLYVNCSSKHFSYNAFSVYDYLRSECGYGENAYVVKAVDDSFEKKTIEVDAAKGDTLADAYAQLLELLNQEVPVDVTMNFAAGKYITEEMLELNGKDISNKYFRLTMKGAENDASVITSNVEFDPSGWRKVEGQEYYRYDFTPDEEGNYPYFRFLYVNGAVAKESTNGFDRTRDAEDAMIAARLEEGAILDPTGVSITDDMLFAYDVANTRNGMWKVPYAFDGIDNTNANPQYKLYLPQEAFYGMADEDFESGQLEFHMPIAWYYRVMHILEVDFDDMKEGNVAAYFDGKELSSWSAQHGFSGNYFWLRNALSFVDEPGEFYYDHDEGILFYYPAEDVDMDTATFEIPTMDDALMAFVGVNYVTIDGLCFYGNDNRIFMEPSTWYSGGQATSSSSARFGSDAKAVLVFQNTNGTTVKNCLIHDVATTGIKFLGVTQNAMVDTNRLFHIGSSGIEFGSHSGTWDLETHANENCSVYNNYLNDIAWFTRGSIGVYISISRNFEMSYNTIKNTSYSATSIGWKWNWGDWEFGTYYQTYNADVHHNYYEGFMSDMSDGGAIYTLGGNVENDYHDYFNSLHDNFCYFNRTTWDGKGMVMPWYHDGGSSNWDDYGSVEILDPFRTVHTPFYLQNILEQLTHNIDVHDNEFIAAFKTWEQYDSGEELSFEDQERKLFGTDGNRPIGIDGQRPTRVDDTRYLSQHDNYVYDRPDWIYDYVYDIIDATGSTLCPPDSYAIIDEVTPIYDLWYLKLEYDWTVEPR